MYYYLYNSYRRSEGYNSTVTLKEVDLLNVVAVIYRSMSYNHMYDLSTIRLVQGVCTLLNVNNSLLPFTSLICPSKEVRVR